MRHRFTKVLLGAALFTLLVGTTTVAARSHHASASYNIGFIYPRTGILGGLRRRGARGLQVRPAVRDERHGQGQRQDAQHHLSGRSGRRGDRRHRGEGPDRPGRQDPDGHRLVRRRGADRAARRAEPGAVHLRPRGRGRDHRHQQVHLPRRAPDDPGRARREVVPRQDNGQEGRRLRPGQRLRSRQLRGRQGVLHRSQRLRDLGAADGHRLHAVRPAGEEREPRPALRRLGRHDRRGDVSRRSTSRASSTARRSSPVSPSARPGRRSATRRRRSTSCRTTSTPLRRTRSNDWLVQQMRKRGQVPDLFTPDGFVEAQMLVHALQKGDYNVDKMISALEGWKFLAPKGYQAIRPQDHAMLQPMFRVALVKKNGTSSPTCSAPRRRTTRRRRSWR